MLVDDASPIENVGWICHGAQLDGTILCVKWKPEVGNFSALPLDTNDAESVIVGWKLNFDLTIAADLEIA